MVASDQNQVFDTGDPSGHPTPVFDQQRQAELVKMQDFLLSQKREEIFGKKRKKKDKKHSKKIVKLPSNNLPQSTANHTAETSVSSVAQPSLEEPRPPRKKVKKAESLLGVSAELPIPNTSNNDSNNETVNSPPKKKIPKAGTSAETVALNAEINAAAQNGNANGNAAGITAEITKKCSPPKKKANKITELASTSSSAAENGSAGGCGTSTAPQIAETSNGNNAKINAEPIESRPPKRLFKSRQWDEDPLPVSAEEPALGNVTLKQCFKCFDSKTENQLIQHLLDKHGIKGKICYDCQLVFRRLKNHKCPHQQQSNTTSNTESSADESTGHDNKTVYDPYAFCDDDFEEENFTVVKQPMKTYSRKLSTESFSSTNSLPFRRNSNIEIPEINPESVAAILKSSQDDVKKAEEEIVKIDDEFPEIKIEPSEENVEDHETFPGKRKRRAPSRLISEDEPQKTVEEESAKIDEVREGAEHQPHFEENLSSVESTPIKNEAAKRSNRYYSPEHTKLLIDLYERTNKYPSKEEMNEIAKIIGVLPIKILWWFTHRRRREKSKERKSEKKIGDSEEEIEGISEEIDTISKISNGAAVTQQIENEIHVLNGDSIVKIELNDSEIPIECKPPKKSPPKNFKPAVAVGDITMKKCLECSESEVFPKKLLLTTHLKEKHDLKIKYCKICNFIFKWTGFKNHTCTRTRTDIDKIKPITPKISPPKIIVPAVAVSDVTLRKCLECSESEDFPKKILLMTHLKEQHNLKIKFCKICNIIFKFAGFKNHNCVPIDITNITPKSPKSPKMFVQAIAVADLTLKQCLECSESEDFAKKIHLITHLKKDHELKIRFCKQCNMIFKFAGFQNHNCVKTELIQTTEIKKESPKKSPPKLIIPAIAIGDCNTKQCLECFESEEFSSRIHLITHLKEKHDLRIRFCKICNIIFKFEGFGNHICSPPEKELSNENNENENLDNEISIICVTPQKPIPSKLLKEFQPAPTFFSRRFHNLLQEFSPKKPHHMSGIQDLEELLDKTSFNSVLPCNTSKNGKFELSYVTPTQLKAVEEFLFGDGTEKVNIFLYSHSKIRISKCAGSLKTE